MHCQSFDFLRYTQTFTYLFITRTALSVLNGAVSVRPSVCPRSSACGAKCAVAAELCSGGRFASLDVYDTQAA